MRNKHSMGRRFLALLLCALMMVGLMPTTALAATKTVSNATDLQNAIKNAGNGDTIKLGGNITFNNSSQITTVADLYQNWEILTYELKREHFSEWAHSLAGIPISGWTNSYNPPWKTDYDFSLPEEFRPEDRRSLRVANGNLIKDSYGETRVRENGDATTYLLIKDKNLTIDLNGYTINASHDDAYFSALFVTGNSSVTIMDSRSGGGITSSGTAVTANGSGAKVTVNGGSLKGNTAVAAIYSGEVHLNGGTFTGADVAEKEFKSAVKLDKESRYETNDPTFGYRLYHYITKYSGTAIRTVPCSTLYSDEGKIYIGENQSITPTFRVPGSGNLYVTGRKGGTSVRISGGIFDTPPHTGYIASGYGLLYKDDGTCEVVKDNDSRVVANVRMRSGYIYYYTTLSEAIKSASTDSTVTLLKNVSGEQILNNNSTYILDLGGNTINGNVTVKTGNVTIKNGTINYTGTGNALKTEGNSAAITAECTINASNGTAISAGYGGSNGGTVNVIGGTYIGKLGTSAGGTLTITGGRYKPDDPSAYLAEGLYAILDSERYYAVTDSPFIEIWNKDDLLAFAQKVNGGDYGANAILMDDIDLSGVTWTPIQGFSGTFNGNGHSITNFISTKGGLFEKIEIGGVVSNVTIKSGNISGGGGAIAYQCHGTIQGCFNYVSVTGKNRVGGIAGSLYGTIEQCGNYGEIKGEQNVGGIVGSVNTSDAIIKNCYNTGRISATNAQKMSYDYNNQTGDSYTGAGGICGPRIYYGRLIRFSVDNCFNYGTVSANNNYFVPVAIQGSNNWHLNATANGSAIPGYASSGTIEAVFARGDITWYLNNSSAEGVWYQTLGVDPYPVLDPTHARVYMGSNGLTNYTYNGYSTNPVAVNGGNTVAGITSKLPKTVTVNSDKPGGGLTAEVTWDTSPLSNYDPDNWEQQTFTLKGTAYVTGLKNGGEKPVQITVTVNAVTEDGIRAESEPTKQAYIDGDNLDLSGAKFIVTYDDVNRTEVELSYDSPGLTYSIGNVNNLVTHGMVLDKNRHAGSLTVRYGTAIGVAGQVRFLSTDNTIQRISCLGTEAVLGDDGEYTLTLPKGSPLPGPDGSEMPGKDYISVTPNDYSVQSINLELVEGRNDYWEITVVAESGDIATYYLEVLIEGWNKDAIDSLKQAWEGIDKTWKPTQAEVQQGTSEAGDDNNLSYEMQLKAWLIQTMVERGMEIPANVTADISFTKGPDWATAGDRYNDRDGEDGEFEFSITFTATQGSEDTHETVTFDSQSGIITATPYAAPDYTVHFNSGGGSPVDDLVVKEDDVIGENAPADPTFEHYTFLGWFTEDNEKWDMENDKVDRNDITLYAHWELTKYKVVLPENQHGYTLTADKEEVVWNESVIFTYKLGVGYNGDALVIKVNGTQVTPDANGQFTVGGNVDSDIVVTVEGVINAPTYTVMIPESVNLDSTATVSAAGVNVADGSSLYVAIGGEFTIANSNPLFKQTIGYPVHKDSKNGTQIQPDDTVLTVAGGIANNTGSQVLYFGLPTEEPKYADDYKGTVTFRIGIKDTE